MILQGKHYIEKDRDDLEMENGRTVPLENASSGQQEILPLTIMLDALSRKRYPGDNPTAYIEEPEARLFPTAQRHIVELIAMVFNTAPEGLQFFTTTHRSYIVTAFNNLMQAGMVKATLTEGRLEELYDIVPEDQALDPKRIRAHALRNEECKSLINPETGLMLAEIIDAVSDELSIQFGEMLEVEG